MRRREFIALFAGAAASPVLWPHAAHAQQPALPVIGFLSSQSPNVYAVRLRAFVQGLKEEGYIEGQKLVHHPVIVIAAAGGTPSALAAKAATATIPIVFAVAVDPMEVGLVASLNRPGGNLTGVTSLNVEIGPKRLELLRELMPTATTVAVLVNPTSPVLTEQFLRSLQAAAPGLGLHLHILHASTERDLDTVFAALDQLRLAALVICPDNFFNSRIEQLGVLALRHAMPAIYQYHPFVRAGGLISYGSSETDYYRLVGVYTGKILKGEKPANLPVMQSTKVELIINLKTAKALGLTVPLSLLGRADEVIE